MTVDTLTIEGFRSIRKLEKFPMRPLNVLIGSNGAGKSNFVAFFRLLRELVEQRLQLALAKTEGGADGCLYLGPKVTQRLFAGVSFGRNGYKFALEPGSGNQLVFADESVFFRGDYTREPRSLGSGHAESKLKRFAQLKDPVPSYVYQGISSWVVYHFHDTSLLSGVRREHEIHDNESLRHDASNLAAFLYRLGETDRGCYEHIRDVVRLAAPFFDDFKLRPSVSGAESRIRLEWTQKGSDYPFQPHQLSDGTLRFICLATALLQPAAPATLIVDEPELGLHPYALALLGDLVAKAKTAKRQVILSTQSSLLLDCFEPEDVVVVERSGAESTFRRLEAADLSEWLDEYSLGELWQKNILGGRPSGDQARALALTSR
ncbi:MAG: AAA family ATPase [Bryobacteraceae bacterium]